MEPRTPTALDDFMFDLNGYLVLKNALEPELLSDLNRAFDNLPPLEQGEWSGNMQRRDYNKVTGYELHNVVEGGEPFERLIDHPSWLSHVAHYCGEEKSYVEGLFIDEAIASIRRSGGHHPVHSGGYRGALRGKYMYEHGVFRCGQVNIICALTDVQEGDGATMVIPGSHKSNLLHPQIADFNYGRGDVMDTITGAVPLYLNAGDALLFCDGLMHGGSGRTNTSGERRVTIYRYGPSWASTRFGYTYSDELLARLTPARRRILQPVPPIRAGERRIPDVAPGNK